MNFGLKNLDSVRFSFVRRFASSMVALWLLLAVVSALIGGVVKADDAKLEWNSDYRAAVQKAKDSKKMLVVFFQDETQPDANRDFLDRLTSDEQVRKGLQQHVCAAIAATWKLDDESADSQLLKHPAFAEMLGQPGFAILDFTDEKSRYFHYVVSVLPFSIQMAPANHHVAELLGLPRGSLTQRSLIFAVRTHPDQPQSTAGETLDVLVQEAEQHSVHQARINLQGHHQWETRFHRINSQIPGGLVAKEVCAESWPGQTLMDAARECVSSWRQSSGHWSAVNGRHPFYGYDMQRGTNGVWYGTGIFATK